MERFIAGRSVGFCTNPECAEFGKGSFLLASGTRKPVMHYRCPCGRDGLVIPEEASCQVEPGETYWKEVRVEFNYKLGKGYRELAIVRDDALLFGSVYELRSPLITTEKRAKALAESILATLNRLGADSERALRDGPIPPDQVFVFSMDRPAEVEAFTDQCLRLERWLLEGGRRHTAPAPKVAA